MLITEKEACQTVDITVPEEMTAELSERAEELNLPVDIFCRMVIEDWLENGAQWPLTE